MSDTLEDLLFSCPALFRTSLRYIGAAQFKGLDEISKFCIKDLLNIAKKR